MSDYLLDLFLFVSYLLLCSLPRRNGRCSLPHNLSLLPCSRLDECDKGNVERPQAQLLRKDTQITESWLKALSSAHQLHTLRETVASLLGEITRLKVEDERMYTEPRSRRGNDT